MKKKNLEARKRDYRDTIEERIASNPTAPIAAAILTLAAGGGGLAWYLNRPDVEKPSKPGIMDAAKTLFAPPGAAGTGGTTSPPPSATPGAPMWESSHPRFDVSPMPLGDTVANARRELEYVLGHPSFNALAHDNARARLLLLDRGVTDNAVYAVERDGTFRRIMPGGTPGYAAPPTIFGPKGAQSPSASVATGGGYATAPAPQEAPPPPSTPPASSPAWYDPREWELRKGIPMPGPNIAEAAGYEGSHWIWEGTTRFIGGAANLASGGLNYATGASDEERKRSSKSWIDAAANVANAGPSGVVKEAVDVVVKTATLRESNPRYTEERLKGATHPDGRPFDTKSRLWPWEWF